MIGVDDMITVLDRTEDLPTLPTIYTKISHLIQDPKTTVAEVAKVIEVDQALTGKILRLVNSSFFGFSRQVASIHQAVVLMGFNTIRNTVLSISVVDELQGNTNGGFSLPRFWQHSLACGVIASVLDKELKGGFQDEIFVAGVLHDMGKIILNRYFAEEFLRVMKYSWERQVSFFQAERAVIGFSHNEVGEYLADKWKLPFTLVEAISLHHQPETIRSNPGLVSLIHLADALTYPIGYGFLNQHKKIQIIPFAMEELDLTRERVVELGEPIKKVIGESRELFALLS